MLGDQKERGVLNMKRLAGFSLIELLIAVVVFGVLTAIAAPTFSTWTQNSRIRTTTQSIENGLQQARAEAIRRNMQVRFQLTDTVTDSCAISASGTSWVISLDAVTSACGHDKVNEAYPLSDSDHNPEPRIIQTRPSAEGGGGVQVLAANSRAVAIFNGYGRLVAVAPDTAPQPLSIDVKSNSGSCTGYRCLRITVTTGGQVRMCDENRPVGDPQRC